MELTREERFRDLLVEVHAPLQRYLRRRTAEHEDVLSETLAVLWRRLDDLPQEPLPWSYGVARACLQNAARSERRRFRLLRRIALEPEAPPPAEDAALAEALAGLAAADQEVLRLWAWEQLPPREIAVVLEISANAASVRLHRATTKLRTALLGDAPIGHAAPRKESRAPGQEQVDGQSREGTHA